jgi:hypothetical protein
MRGERLSYQLLAFSFQLKARRVGAFASQGTRLRCFAGMRVCRIPPIAKDAMDGARASMQGPGRFVRVWRPALRSPVGRDSGAGARRGDLVLASME